MTSSESIEPLLSLQHGHNSAAESQAKKDMCTKFEKQNQSHVILPVHNFSNNCLEHSIPLIRCKRRDVTSILSVLLG